MRRLKGVVVVVPTPLNEDETADLEATERLIEFLAGQGLGLFALGSAGEKVDRINHGLMAPLTVSTVIFWLSARASMDVKAVISRPASIKRRIILNMTTSLVTP